MKDPSAKLIQYIQAGYHIKRCMRMHAKRMIKLEAPIFSIFQPTLKLTEQEYEKAMRTLIAWLIQMQKAGEIIEICTSHYGHEWVELRTSHGKLKSKLALSVRAIHSLKHAMMDNIPGLAADPASDESAVTGASTPAEFPRQLPRKPALAPESIPAQWR